MPIPPPASTTASDRAIHRFAAVDAARGLAILAMVAYHFCWDLDLFGFARFPLTEDALWLAARTVIVSAFLLLAGMSLVLATARGLDRRRFLRRLGLLVAAAATVSAVSYVGFPESPIFFGVLHHIAVASVVGLAILQLPSRPVATVAIAALGIAVIALPALVGPVTVFDAPELLWIGLPSEEPSSNDYVPLVPWFGVVLLGMALARRWPPAGIAPGWRPGRAGNALARAGRHSLAIYLLHQPVLFAGLWLAAAAVGPAGDRQTQDFLMNCQASCRANGVDATSCATSCGCVATDLKGAGLWEDMLADRLYGNRRAQFDAVIAACVTDARR